MRIFVALAALLTAAQAIPQETEPTAYKHDSAAIVLVRCERPEGSVTGTAFKVGPTFYMTAHHVVESGTCAVNGIPVSIDALDAEHDFATFTGPPSPAVLATTCEGFHTGETYIARGYPGGIPMNIFTPWIASLVRWDGFRYFTGEVYPGMSGGPVIDAKSRVVGIVNRRWPARSMPLQLTGYCKQ